jgi:signal transduction histidine kinase
VRVSALSGDEGGAGVRPSARVLQTLRAGALGGSLLVLAVALVVVVGWAFDVDALKRIAAGFAPMKLNAALCYALVAAVVLLEVRPPARVPSAASEVLLGLVLVIAGLTAVEHLLDVDLGIDELLVHDDVTTGPTPHGQMSLMGATCLLLLSVALLALRRRAHRTAQSLAIAVAVLSTVGLLGYVYDVGDLYEEAFFRSLALLSAVCLLVLALAVLCLDGESWLMSWVTRDSPEGWAIRVLVPAAYLAPTTLGYFVVTGVREDWYSLPIGAAVAVPVMTIVCVVFIGLIARRLHDSEIERRRVVASLALAHDELGRRVEYAGIVAHDLRNPLAAILVYARLLEEQRTLTDPERAKRHAAQIVHVAETMGIILEDILSVAKLEAGTMEVERGRLELVDFLDTLQLQAEVAYPDARLRADVRVGELWVEGDAVQLSRVLLNLLSNAVKYGAPGSQVDLVLLRQQNSAVLKVVDHGAGIPPEDVPVLFEKFSRLPSGAKLEGSGLGLYICKSIVEAHGGEIWVEETPGGGATFCVSLTAVARQRSPDLTRSR